MHSDIYYMLMTSHNPTQSHNGELSCVVWKSRNVPVFNLIKNLKKNVI